MFKLNASVVSEMIGSNFKVFRGDKEEDIVMFTLYFDVCFITSDKGVYITFILYIEAMAVKGGSGCIIKDSLIRDIGSRGVRAGMNKFILKSA